MDFTCLAQSDFYVEIGKCEYNYYFSDKTQNISIFENYTASCSVVHINVPLFKGSFREKCPHTNDWCRTIKAIGVF